MNPWTLAALVAMLAFRTKEGRVISKKALRATVTAGIAAKEASLELYANAKENLADIIAEVHDERAIDAKKVKSQSESASSYE